MRKLKELFRLKFEHGLSNRKIALSCNTSHSVVGQYLIRFEQAGLKWPMERELGEGELDRLLIPRTKEEGQARKVLPEWNLVYEDMKKHKHLTLQLVWLEYRRKEPEGYGYSQFCRLYRGWQKRLSFSFRRNYRGGEKLFVDYAGEKVKISCGESGMEREVSIFVAVLGASNYCYVEAQSGQDIKNWLQGHVRTFQYLGGVPEVIVPDNLKSGVTSPCFYEPAINPSYQDMVAHYHTTVLPARIRKPKDKAKVEAGVKIVEQQILAALRNRKFFSLFELNKAIRECLEELNNREMKSFKKSRRQLFETLDLPNLNPLPERPYEFAEVKKGTLGIDYHVRYENNHYSAPCRYARRQVEIRATEKVVEIYYKYSRIASHLRCYGKNQFITCKEHMPANHQFVADWNPYRFIRWAEKIGPQCVLLIEKIFEQKEYPQQSYRKCLGILSLAKRYGADRLELSCQRALRFHILSYKKLKDILEKGLEKIELPINQIINKPAAIIHKNIRGREYYNPKESN